MNKVIVSTQAEYDSLPASFEVFTVIEIRNAQESIWITKKINSIVDVYDNSIVWAPNNTIVRLSDNGMVWSLDNVWPDDNNEVKRTGE
jgi:hypothetical protein